MNCLAQASDERHTGNGEEHRNGRAAASRYQECTNDVGFADAQSHARGTHDPKLLDEGAARNNACGSISGRDGLTFFQPYGEHATAIISPCGVYRYQLTRTWGNGKRAAFVMLNPSTADAVKNDATIRKCVTIAKRLGCKSLVVVNLFAYRATNPRHLLTAPDPVGPFNAGFLAEVAQPDPHTVIICAWGQHGHLHGRGAAFIRLAREEGAKLHALKINKSGEPAHPLYLPLNPQLVELPIGCA